jgi:hypothetical protein
MEGDWCDCSLLDSPGKRIQKNNYIVSTKDFPFCVPISVLYLFTGVDVEWGTTVAITEFFSAEIGIIPIP